MTSPGTPAVTEVAEPAEVSPTPVGTPPGAPPTFVLAEDGLRPLAFGDDASTAIEQLSDALGQPTSAGSWVELVPWTDPYGHNTDTYATGDPEAPTDTWSYPAWRQACWSMLCVDLARDEQGAELFVAWSVSAFNGDFGAADLDRPEPDLATAEGVGVGSTWGEVLEAYPDATFSYGEGRALGYSIGWPEVCDGAACGTGRLASGSTLPADPVPQAPRGGSRPRCGGGRDPHSAPGDCPDESELVISMMAGEHLNPSCC